MNRADLRTPSWWALKAPTLVGLSTLAAVVAHVWVHDWLAAVGLAPWVVMFPLVNRLLDHAFQQGWAAATHGMDGILESVSLSPQIRALLLFTMMMPTGRRHHLHSQAAMFKELELMENPTMEDMADLFRRYHRRNPS